EAGEPVRKSDYATQHGVAVDAWPDSNAADVETLSNRNFSTDCNSLTDSIVDFPDVGDVLSGFRLLRQIGQGKFGRVFLAEQNSLSARLVVVKITANRTSESQRLARLQHTNIVPIYSEHDIDGLNLICMPYLGETTLADIIRSNRTTNLATARGSEFFDVLAAAKGDQRASSIASANALANLSYVDACLQIARQIAEGMRHAHDRGILHKDLKPANVLMSDDGEPLLLDFNLSDQIVPGGVAGMFVGGTIPYMSPEQIRSLEEPELIDMRTDVFSFGAVLYELLTGHMPFADSLEREPPEPPSNLNGAIPISISDLVLKCLNTDPNRRYSGFEQIAIDLDRHFQNRPLVATPNRSSKERMIKWMKRHPRLASQTSIGVLSILLVASIAVAMFTHRYSERRSSTLDTMRHVSTVLPDLEVQIGTTDTSLPDVQAGREKLLKAASSLGLEVGEDIKPELPYDLAGYLSKSQADELQSLRMKTMSLLGYATERAARHESDQAAKLELTRQASEYLEIAREDSTGPGDIMKLLLDGRFEQAVPLLEAKRTETRLDFPTWMHLGQCYLATGRLSDAESCFSTCVVLWPESHKAFLYRGICYLQMQNDGAAEADFDKALLLRPGWEAALYNRSIARRSQGDQKGALTDLDTIVNKGNPTPRVFLARARILNELGENLAASEDQKNAYEAIPASDHDYVALGMDCINSDPKLALEYFYSAAEFNPACRKAYRNVIYLFAEKFADANNALDAATKMIDEIGPTADDLMSRAVLQARLGNAEQAQRDVEAALQIYESPQLQFQAACVFALSKSTDNAFRHLWESVKSAPSWLMRLNDSDLDNLREDPRFQRFVRLARDYARAQVK
ncbi:MAG: protein kinase, partial [Planctomycetales bacterium]|nr:protein kinase [Planctomycetales bacterium]